MLLLKFGKTDHTITNVTSGPLAACFTNSPLSNLLLELKA